MSEQTVLVTFGVPDGRVSLGKLTSVGEILGMLSPSFDTVACVDERRRDDGGYDRDWSLTDGVYSAYVMSRSENLRPFPFILIEKGKRTDLSKAQWRKIEVRMAKEGRSRNAKVRAVLEGAQSEPDPPPPTEQPVKRGRKPKAAATVVLPEPMLPLPVIEPEPVTPSSQLGSTPVEQVAEPVSEPEDGTVLQDAVAAKVRLDDRHRKDWADWLIVGRGLMTARQIAIHESRSNAGACGTTYNHAFGRVLTEAGLVVEKNARNTLIKIMLAEREVERWRNTLTEPEKTALNNPRVVWAAYSKRLVSLGPTFNKPKPPNAKALIAQLDSVTELLDRTRVEAEAQRTVLKRLFGLAAERGINLPMTADEVEAQVARIVGDSAPRSKAEVLANVA